MSDDLVVKELKRLLGKVRDLAVEAERERCAQVAFNNQHLHAQFVGQKILKSEPESAPAPDPEPMTIATMIAKLSAISNANWHTIRGNLEKLVQEQARRDAAIAKATILQKCRPGVPFGHHLHDAILKAAGLQ
jgi:hypothetical protein